MSVPTTTVRCVRVKLYLTAAVACAAVLHLYGSSPAVSIATGVCLPIALAVAPRFLMGAVAGASMPGRHENTTTEMTGLEFEDFVARIARSCGVPVIMTPLSGDWGVDLIVGHRPNRVAVQCKRQSRPVGAGAVQEVVAGAPMQDCAKTMVVTNHEFTPAARKLAELHGCELIGGADLPRLKSVIRKATQ
jgi:restriction system protein